ERERRVGRERAHQSGYRLFGEDRIGSAYRCLAVVERIPREAKTRLEVIVVLTVDQRNSRANLLNGRGRRVKDIQTVETLCRRLVPVITQTQLQREIGLQLEVVLNEEPQFAGAEAV